MPHARIFGLLMLFGAVTAPASLTPALAQNSPQSPAPAPAIGKKLQPYIACINRLSERAMGSRARYFSWANEKTGPSGKERVIYGVYTIYDTKDCEAGVARAATEAPPLPALEKAGAAFAEALRELAPVLNEANDYYEQGNYKDDAMARGKALHPRLVAAYARFAAADKGLRAEVETLNDRVQIERLAAIEKAEGRSVAYLGTDLMIKAKALLRAEAVDARDFDLARVNAGIDALAQAIAEIEKYNDSNPPKKASSSFISAAKSFLTSAKALMRRIRDKTPYSQGERMLMGSGGGGWMVEGSPARLERDYNQLVGAYNSGVTF